MLIDDIDFADLYLQQLKLAHRTEKTPDHWDQRAEKMAENCASPTDSYLQQLTAKIDLQGAQTLFDMGCGPGTVSLALADKLTTIYGVDYSQGMLKVAARRAAALRQTMSTGSSAPGKRTGVTCHAAILPWLPAPLWWLICARQ
ncbi:putative methyltransferase [Escherichia coli]|uniref:Putative methyltransferase n=1 Tax=Escherichia coli TaxID=562 RepID=A0A377D2M6_ECOLX|nr:putative methyltransferase [Escherichia coli]